MDIRQFHKRLYDAANRLIPRGSTVVCATSGGADSTALLQGLHEVNGLRRCRWRLHVAHLNHNLRSDSAEAASFVEKAAADLKLPCTIQSEIVRARSESSGESIEEAARHIRYRFLEDVSRQIGARVAAVGHHADDQAETVLHRIVRGTGLRGLAGMSEKRPIRRGSVIELVRPMLGLRRDDSRTFLQRRGIEFLHDTTNDDVSIATRNRIRHELLPIIESSFNSNAVEALLRLAEQARRASSHIRQEAEGLYVDLVNRDESGAVNIDVEALQRLSEALRSEILRLVLERLDVGFKGIGFERFQAVLETTDGDSRFRRIELNGGVIVERRGSKLRIVRTDRTRVGTEASLSKECCR